MPCLRAAFEIPRLTHVYRFWRKRQHHGSFHITAVDAKAVFFRAEQAVDLFTERQREPIDAEHKHVQPRAQIPRHDIHHTDLSAMRVQQHQLPDARAMHALAQLRP
jgi:hypothetical protein